MKVIRLSPEAEQVWKRILEEPVDGDAVLKLFRRIQEHPEKEGWELKGWDNLRRDSLRLGKGELLVAWNSNADTLDIELLITPHST